MKGRRLGYGLGALAGLYLVLLIPLPEEGPPAPGPGEASRPFAWRQDARWDALEAGYAAARAQGCAAIAPRLAEGRAAAERALSAIEGPALAPSAPEFQDLEDRFFSLGPLVAACPEAAPSYLALASRLRVAVKRQSERWAAGDRAARETVYRLLYGARCAAEEAILQAPPGARPGPLLREAEEPSATPAAALLGAEVHSGDLLVSRGDAPTSALIARGSDFPGNFSHVALAHVDAASGRLRIVEALLERGLVVSEPEAYLRDTKLRVMVLRPRADLPAIAADPMLPHRAATALLERAAGHVAYDFSMDAGDDERLFCCEVPSSAYRALGVSLWPGLSHVSSPGARAWLHALGVRYFETLEPSDLEYDPQLRVVAEWRDPAALERDHADAAVVDAMLEGAERGDRLGYAWYLLPAARFVKAYSAARNAFGGPGPIPEGMTAAAALRVEAYRARHAEAAARVRAEAERFRRERGYAPPYWELLRMARRATGG